MELLRLETTAGENKIFCEVEHVCTNYYSVVCYDWNGDLWVEKFVTSEVEAVALCHKMFNKYSKQ
jgi:hypothetical protein